jgi:hypothetical protein
MSIEKVNDDQELVDLREIKTVVESSADQQITQLLKNAIKSDPILCPHCQRTASNGIKCKGICVAESGY